MQIKYLVSVILLSLSIYHNASAQCNGPDSIIVALIQADNAKFIWDQSEATAYTLEIGVQGFVQGGGLRFNTADTVVVVPSLLEKTVYDVYLYSSCSNGMMDTVSLQVESLHFNDIGVSFLDAPMTGCDLTNMEPITFSVTNYGQNPQQLFEFSYSLEDVEGNVMVPFDGLYAGIVGFDSTVMTTFDMQVDLMEPGEYNFKIWTALENDQNRSNDTFEILITHQPVIRAYPYEWDFEEWKGGWLIDEAASTNSSMAFGRPNEPTITEAASGTAAWVTNLLGAYNANETTVLISPCFDFSSMNNDPYMSFALNFNGEECCDFAIAEISINAGRNWTKIGDGENGINWYNNNDENRWDGNGQGNGWSRVQNRLFGAAGRDSVRLRYIFQSDGSNQSAGMGIDDIHIYEPYFVDAAVAVIDHQSEIECGLSTDSVVVAVENTGQDVLTSFILTYTLNDGPAIGQTISTSIAPGDRDTIVLATAINTAMDGTYNLRAWVTAPGDLYPENDTLTRDFVIQGVQALPLIEDFEGTDFPKGWTSNNGNIGIDHGSPSSIFYSNLNTVSSTFELTVPNVGPISTGDVLKFDYRIVDNATTSTTLNASDQVEVQISTDCGVSYARALIIDQSNHVGSLNFATQEIPLSAFDGQDIKVRFIGTHGGGGAYFIDIDNVNILACPVSLELSFEQQGTSGSGTADGTVSVQAAQGTANYAYNWSNGMMTASISGISSGNYAVTVTDANGCEESSSVDVVECSALALTINTTQESNVGGDGTAMVMPLSGTGPFTYLWDNGVQTDMIWDLSMGTYNVTVTDANGCTGTDAAVIDVETSITSIPDLKALSVYPNPSSDFTNVDFELDESKPASIQLFNGFGQLLWHNEAESSSVHQFDIETLGYPTGIYFIRVQVEANSITKRLLIQR